MKRSWNILVWLGFAIVVVALVSYIPFFALFPATRDFPWANYLLFLIGGLVLAGGVRRAFRDAEHYRGKISGSILYTSVGATLRGYTVVVPADTTNAPTDYEVPIGIYAMLNQNAANPTNEPLKPRCSTLSRSDLITFE